MSTEEDIEALKAKLAEHEASISKNEQDKVDHSTGHKFLILVIVLVLAGLAIYFTGNWPAFVKICYRLYQQAADMFMQLKTSVQGALGM